MGKWEVGKSCNKNWEKQPGKVGEIIGRMGRVKTWQQKWGKTMWKSVRNNWGKWEVGNLATKNGKKCKWGLLRESDSWGDGQCPLDTAWWKQNLMIERFC